MIYCGDAQLPTVLSTGYISLGVRIIDSGALTIFSDPKAVLQVLTLVIFFTLRVRCTRALAENEGSGFHCRCEASVALFSFLCLNQFDFDHGELFVVGLKFTSSCGSLRDLDLSICDDFLLALIALRGGCGAKPCRLNVPGGAVATCFRSRGR